MFEYEEIEPFIQLIERDKRYTFGAYLFVNEAIEVATRMGIAEWKRTERQEGEEVEEKTDKETSDESELDVEPKEGTLLESSDEESDSKSSDSTYIDELMSALEEAMEGREPRDFEQFGFLEEEESEEDDEQDDSWNATDDLSVSLNDVDEEEQDEFESLLESMGEQEFSDETSASREESEASERGEDDALEPHITGRQLCQVAVSYAVGLYGYMARTTLKQLGLNTTSDIGEVVYNMISIGLTAKSEEDSREDFDNLFDLGQELDATFKLQYKKRRR